MNKKLLVILCGMLLVPSFADANLRFNQQTGMYFSEGARKNVDPIEYHNLVIQWIRFAEANPYLNNVDGITCVQLKIIGTPASLRLIHDIKKLCK